MRVRSNLGGGLACGVACGVAVLVCGAAHAATPYWANWESLDLNNSVSGTLATDAGPVWLVYSGEFASLQLNRAGTNYFAVEPSSYISPGCDAAPNVSDSIAIAGGPDSGAHTVWFWPMVTDPIMAIAGMGRAGAPVTYRFDAPFEVLSSGTGAFGGPGTLTKLPGNTLLGEGGHGVIRFHGTYWAISWTAPDMGEPQWFTVGATGAAPACVGDLNYDGFVDDSDFVLFASAYNILDCFDPAMPPFCPADLNYDTTVDDADFVIFAAAYNELVCP